MGRYIYNCVFAGGTIMNRSKHIEALPDYKTASTAAYVTGFFLSLALTIAAFTLVWAQRSAAGEMFSRGVLLGLLAVIATMQIVVQMLFFLHLSAERRLRFNLLGAVFTVFVVLCLVVGSIWIMQNLDYNMSPHKTTQFMQTEENIGR